MRADLGNQQGRSGRLKPAKQRSANRATAFVNRLRRFVEGWRRPWIWIERGLLLSGFALVVIYGAVRMESLFSSRAAIREFESASLRPSSSVVTNDHGQSTLDLPEVDFSLWSKKRIQAYRESAGNRPDTPLALLEIPKIHLEVPVFDGTDDLTLNHAVGRITGTAWPAEQGNVGIAGHRDGFFRGLKDLAIGDVIELRTLNGKDTYVVDQIQIVDPSDVQVLLPKAAPSLTLVTCYPFYFIGSAPQRYIVSASRRHTQNQDQAPQVAPAVTNAVLKGENNASLE